MHTLNPIRTFQIERTWAQIREPVMTLVDEAHSRGQAQNSELNRKLEQRLAEWYGRKHCLTTACGTDSLVISLIALDLPPGSKIGVSNYTFTASATSVHRAGHYAIPVDVTDNYTIDINKLPDVDALVVVDIYGNMSDWDRINQLGIPVVLDAAQSMESLHSKHGWSPAQGNAACISFSPSKTINSFGSGGAVLTDDDNIAQLARKLRLHGKEKNWIPSIHPGLNSMLSSFEAACVWVGLDHSEEWVNRRREIATYLAQQSKWECVIDFDLQRHTLHKLVFRTETQDQRDQILKDFDQAKIEGRIHYELCINDESLYYSGRVLEKSQHLQSVSFTTPNQQTLTDNEVERIAEVIK